MPTTTKGKFATSTKKAAKPEVIQETKSNDLFHVRFAGIQFEEFSLKLNLACRIAPNRPIHPILGNIKLEADTESQTIALTAFDLNLGVRLVSPARVVAGGTVLFDGRYLLDIISKFDAVQDLSLTLNETPKEGDRPSKTELAIKINSSSYKLKAIQPESLSDGDEYPDLPKPGAAGEELSLPPDILNKGINSTVFTTHKDEAKATLCGVRLTAGDDAVEFASTDGHRLSVYKHKLQKAIAPCSVTLPKSFALEIQRVLCMEEELGVLGGVKLLVESDRLFLETSTTRLLARSLEGAYPEYQKLIPRSFKLRTTVVTKALKNSIELLSVLAKDGGMKLELSPSYIDLDVVSQDGFGYERIDASTEAADELNIEKDPFALAFKCEYLKTALRCINKPEVAIGINHPMQPVVIRTLEATDSQEEFLYLLMPMELKQPIARTSTNQ